MTQRIILASGSEIRQQLLRNAGVDFTVQAPRTDEEMIRTAMEQEAAPPRDIADALAEHKALKISRKAPDALVIGCDQVLDTRGKILSKPPTQDQAIAQLKKLRGTRHSLLSAVVICENAMPTWRHVGQVHLQMHDLSDAYIAEYVARNWNSIRHSVGAYKLEEEGARLFSRIEGDYFTVLGLPLLELLSYLSARGVLKR